jgi:hypothetical protein
MRGSPASRWRRSRWTGSSDTARGAMSRLPVCRIRQSASDAPCGAARSRLRDRRVCASGDGIRAHVSGAGYSAGTSVCPWPRLSLLVASGHHRVTRFHG